MAKKSASAGDKVGDLRQQMNDLGGGGLLGDDTVRQATDTASAVAGIAQEQVGALAEVIKRQPIAALLIGMTGAYLLGRIVTSIRR